LISPVEAIQARARQDSTTVDWFFNDFNLGGASNVAAEKAVAIVFLNSDSGEGYITVCPLFNPKDLVNSRLYLRRSMAMYKSPFSSRFIMLIMFDRVGRRQEQLNGMAQR
jgi:hypothetical protein